MSAQNVQWAGNGVEHNWSDTKNWDPDLVPGGADFLLIDAPDDTFLDQDFSIDGLLVKGGSTVRTNERSLVVGASGLQLTNGELTVEETSSELGGLVAETIAVADGELFLESGAATITGAMTSQDRVTGSGKLTFTGGGNVFSNNGAITVRQLAPDGFSFLTVAATNAAAKIDLDGAGSNGRVNMDANTQFNLLVPLTDDFNGGLSLFPGATFSHPYEMVMGAGAIINVQSSPNEAATIETRGYRLTEGAQMRFTTGALRMTSGLSVDEDSSILMLTNSVGTGGSLRLNGTSDIRGSVTLPSGTGLVVESGTTTIDTANFQANEGDLTAEAGATLAIRSRSTSSSTNNYHGQIRVNSGGMIDIEHEHHSQLELESAGEIRIETGGTFRGDDILTRGRLAVVGELTESAVVASKLILTDEARLQAIAPLRLEGGFEVMAGANIQGNTGQGQIQNMGPMEVESGSGFNTLVVNSGTFDVTGEMGPVSILNFEQTAGGSISFRIGDGEFDRVLTSELVLDGTLSVELVNGFVPELGDRFEIFTGDVSGDFSEMNLPSLPAGLDWRFRADSPFRGLTVIEGVTGDFDRDGDYSCADVDSLVAAIVDGDTSFDLTGDGAVDSADLDAWLAEAGAAENASGNPYLYGDANLDSVVDASDFNIWNNNNFTATSSWCSGDFNADGVVDASDFNQWNNNKFQSADSLVAVPEANASLLMLCGVVGLIASRRKSGQSSS